VHHAVRKIPHKNFGLDRKIRHETATTTSAPISSEIHRAPLARRRRPIAIQDVRAVAGQAVRAAKRCTRGDGSTPNGEG